MNTREKGNKAERECKEYLEREGYVTYRVSGSTKFQRRVDMFANEYKGYGFDIVAKRYNETIWIQVKHRTVALKHYTEFAKMLCKHERVELWIRQAGKKAFWVKRLVPMTGGAVVEESEVVL